MNSSYVGSSDLTAESRAACDESPRLAYLRTLIADDSYAITFQTFGQYRTALLKAIDAIVELSQPALESDAINAELLEALQECAALMGPHPGSLAVKVRAAIAKATA